MRFIRLAAVAMGWVSLSLMVREVRAEGTGPPFRAGAAMSNITPWLGISVNGGMSDRKATHVHDELHARCLVLESGSTRVAIVTCDSCMIPREVFDEAKRIAQEQTGIAADHMLMAATHTHYAPTSAGVFQSEADTAYQEFLARRIADGIRRASNNLAPAQVGWAVGTEPNEVNNRRWKMKPGTIPPNPFGRATDQVKMNPPVGSPDLVEPAGPTDPDVSVVSVRSSGGQPIALLANYSLHYVGGGPGDHITADYYGCFADRMQQLLSADRLDPPFVAMMSNGTSGDINNVDFRGRKVARPGYGQMRHVAGAVAAAAYDACQSIRYRDRVPLDMRQMTLKLGVRKPTTEEVDRARDIVDKAGGPVMKTLEQIYAKETLAMADYPDEVELILQAVRIGDLAIAAIPCEVFVEIGLEIKRKSPFKPSFVMQLANGYNGYLPTVEAHAQGGYETWRAKSSYLEIQAAPKIVNAVTMMLDDLKNPEK